MKESFVKQNLSADSIKKIALVNSILSEYEELGYDLTLRQLYYQLVARGGIENSQKSYKRTGDLVNNARLAGLVDWRMITDRGRSTVANNHWEDPAEIMQAAADSFQIDKWQDQTNYVLVMVEKQALEGVLIPACRELDVTFAANKGYSSSSTMYKVGKHLRYQCLENDKLVHVLYLGDHDPSGIDMTRDVRERLEMFSGVDIDVRRLALNWDQVEQWQPPENPAKETDSRYGSYVEQFGESSWELDAIEPRTLAELVTEAVLELRDEDLWNEAEAKENAMKTKLMGFVKEYRSRGDE
jgi:hypothetical protein